MQLGVLEKLKMADRCICGCGRFVDVAGDYATEWCIENHSINQGDLAEIRLRDENPEEPDIVY